MPYILLALTVAVAFWMVSVCNSLVRMRNKADEAYLSVMACSGEEKRRQMLIYNDLAGKYNSKISSFPNMLVTTLFGFEEKGIFR